MNCFLKLIVIIVSIFICESSLFALEENKKKAEPVDKRGYYFFKPVPRSQMRELNTDRPDKTESAMSVNPGHIQAEIDIGTFVFDKWNPEKTKLQNLGLGLGIINFKLGLTHNMDFQFVMESYKFAWLQNSKNKNLELNQGFGNITLRLKTNIVGNNGGPMAVGLMPFIKIPTHQNNLDNPYVEGGIMFLFSHDLPKGWELGSMLQIDINRNNDGNGVHPEFITTITVGHDLVSNLGLYLELYNLINAMAVKNVITTFDAGLTYRVTPDIQLDLGVNTGLTPAADDVNVFLGTTFRY